MENLLSKIRRRAREDAKRRQDPRFLETMGFLLAKGFLKTDLPIPRRPNKKLTVDDAVWAGRKVEPRILEVLPAALLRFPRHFITDTSRHYELLAIVKSLRNGDSHGPSLWNIPFDKLRAWQKLPTADGRVKLERRIVKTFRLSPTIAKLLKESALQSGCTETEILEQAIRKGSLPP